MATHQILFAGFGGQGILFSGRFMAYNGLYADKQVSWLPSYGPEMRGGAANCHVIISDTPIGTPIIINPDYLVTMNLPSFEKYESSVAPGGMLFYDSSMIDRKCERTDISVFPIPATKLAADNGIDTLANMIIVGKLIRESGIIDFGMVPQVLKKIVSARRAQLIELNQKALDIGFNYTE